MQGVSVNIIELQTFAQIISGSYVDWLILFYVREQDCSFGVFLSDNSYDVKLRRTCAKCIKVGTSSNIIYSE